MFQKILILLLFVSLTLKGWCVEICSRTAVINGQKILVDLNSGQKGEGLRFYIEKDEKALSYLNLYQKENQKKWPYITLGSITLGSFLALAVNDFDRSEKNILIGAGILSLVFNISLNRFSSRQNEKNLIRAIEEYNRRNLPKIDFKSDTNVGRVHSQGGFSLGTQWSF
ncbi:MAG: hypothetical protein H6622_02370 [Halobacteriovoraceae bacterium]|nr:hypothetical protein [Halobacteriovoraceae bacterium]